VIQASFISWLDPNVLLDGVAGPIALLVVCAIVFAETGLLIGFLLPGDTLLFFTGVLAVGDKFGIGIGWICLAIAVAAFLGGELGYYIGHRFGPKVFERKESGLFSVESVRRTNAFFKRYGGLAVIIVRFVPVVRTFGPVAAGIGHMDYRKYTLYNLIGALIWGAGVTLLGNVLGRIPFVRDFAEKYLDLVLITVVLLTLVPSVWHYVQATRRARRAGAAGQAATAAAAADIALDPEVFEQPGPR